ncbi:interferon-induced GTP-binding protein MxB-like isoform X2 [Pseudorasbora parva]|uniref:interferon-induced GTP-binding protein MxB-like isoform X2 n=1 Tax=Pseudorasbora parva TaxID=51549 RepID=UPI00351DC167
MKKLSYTFSQQYEEKIRPYIDTIDNLRSLGVEKDLALPAIAVIGDQSSGKSSILEALSGVALPRGSGIVTRCPLELKMIRTKDEDKWHGRISYQDDEEDFYDPAEVEAKIREAQDVITGVGDGISDELISLQITSANVPDLTLIDLPGIARVAVNGQPENIGDQTKTLIRKFVSKQETINLVVVPCNVDIATTEALKMAQEEDPNGERTLGILTKPDLVDKGTEGTVVDIVHNEVIPLCKGYMIVKCRGQNDITNNVSLDDATAKENVFFKDHPHFRKLYEEGFATIPKLAEKLTIELVHHIQKSLPNLKEQIDERLTETQMELEKYGKRLPLDPAERWNILRDKLKAFTEDTLKLTKGEAVKCASDLRIFPELRKEFTEWNNFLNQDGELYSDIVHKSFTDINEIKENGITDRGRELEGFILYNTFEELVGGQMKRLEKPAIQMLKKISNMVRNTFTQLAQDSFNGFPNLVKIAKTKIEDIKQDKESEAEKMLKTQFEMELIVYSQDGIYRESLQAVKDKLKKNEETEEKGNCRLSLLLLDLHATLYEMMERLRAYYMITSKRLADHIPKVILYMLLHESALKLDKSMMELLKEKDDIDNLLEEDVAIGQKRKTLLSRQKRLEEARILLNTI